MYRYQAVSKEQLALLEKGIIDIVGEVDGDMMGYVREAIAYLKTKDNPKVSIQITSQGGQVAPGLDIYDLIRLYPGESVGQVFGYCRSSAVIILQACKHRQAARHASILIHEVSRNYVSLNDLRSKRQRDKLIYDGHRSQSRIIEIIAEKTGKNHKTIQKEFLKNKDMSSEEALAFGLIDEII